MHYSLATIDLQAIRDAVAAVDAAVFRLINTGLGARWLDPVMVAITTLGVGAVQAAIGLGAVITGSAKHRVDIRRMGYAVLIAYAGSGVLSQLIKAMGDRPRPVLVMFDVRLPYGPLFIHSFPSGHATTAFAAAFVWAAFLPRWRWVFYALAGLVAFSRVYLGVHFPLDVVYGGLLGCLIGMGSARIVRPRPGQSPATTIDTPELRPGRRPATTEDA